MTERILVVDDETEIADLVEVYLKSENYCVVKAYNAKSALSYLEEEEPDLAILDIMLPDMSGFDLCRKIREGHNYPIIMLTACDREMDKVSGLALGADDYITKPFRPLELTARVKAQLRRYKKYSHPSQQNPSDQQIIAHSGLVMDVNAHECLINDKPLQLTPTEFTILRILLENRGKVVSAEGLFHAIWKDEYYTKSNNTITVHIRHLREKMGDAFTKPVYIKTIWGVGYKIE